MCDDLVLLRPLEFAQNNISPNIMDSVDCNRAVPHKWWQFLGTNPISNLGIGPGLTWFTVIHGKSWEIPKFLRDICLYLCVVIGCDGNSSSLRGNLIWPHLPRSHMFVLEAAAVHLADLEPHGCVPGSIDGCDGSQPLENWCHIPSNQKCDKQKPAEFPSYFAWVAMHSIFSFSRR